MRISKHNSTEANSGTSEHRCRVFCLIFRIYICVKADSTRNFLRHQVLHAVSTDNNEVVSVETRGMIHARVLHFRPNLPLSEVVIVCVYFRYNLRSFLSAGHSSNYEQTAVDYNRGWKHQRNWEHRFPGPDLFIKNTYIVQNFSRFVTSSYHPNLLVVTDTSCARPRTWKGWSNSPNVFNNVKTFNRIQRVISIWTSDCP